MLENIKMLESIKMSGNGKIEILENIIMFENTRCWKTSKYLKILKCCNISRYVKYHNVWFIKRLKNQDTGNYQDVWNIKMLDNAYIKMSDNAKMLENIRYP